MERDAHLGVVSREMDDVEMESQEFFSDSIALIVPANHPWATRASIEPDELLEEPLILREPASGTRRVVLAELAKNDITVDDLNVFLELAMPRQLCGPSPQGMALHLYQFWQRNVPWHAGKS